MAASFYSSSINSFLKSFNDTNSVPADQLEPMIVEAKKGKSWATERIISSHQKFILTVAHKYGLINYNNPDDVEDMMIAGSIGIMDAIRLFDEAKGTPFISCAEINIRNRLSENYRLMTQVIHLPKTKAQQLAKIKKLLKAENLEKTDEKALVYLSNKTGIAYDDVKKLLSIDFSFFSMEKPTDDNSSIDFTDTYALNNQETIEDRCINSEIKSIIKEVLKTLSEREQILIRLYYGFDGNKLTCREIGEKYNITRQRVQQIIKSAEEKIRTNKLIKSLIDAVA